MPTHDPDYTVRIVDDAGDADWSVITVNGIDDLHPATGDTLVWNGSSWVNVAPNLPWQIDINVYAGSIANTNWNAVSIDAQAIANAYLVSSGAQNDEVNWDVVLAAGTWTVALLATQASYAGIITVQLEGVESGTVDCYNAALTYNVHSTVAGVVVATTGKKRLKLKMATKNASSAAFYGLLQAVQLRRTA